MEVTYNRDEIEAIRRSCRIASEALAVAGRMVRPGVTTRQIDGEVEAFIAGRGARPAFKGYRDYPAAICASVNEAVVHGLPSDKPLRAGDLVSIDVGVLLDGWYGDTAYTFGCGRVSESDAALLRTTLASLEAGIAAAVVGNRTGAVGAAVQALCEAAGYGIVRDLAGHGVGRRLHEDPNVPNYGTPDQGVPIEEGMVFAIEPMVNKGTARVRVTGDGWTIRTQDRKQSAHFEHTVAIIDGKAQCLSTFENIGALLSD